MAAFCVSRKGHESSCVWYMAVQTYTKIVEVTAGNYKQPPYISGLAS